MIKEHDRVILTGDLPGEDLRAGDVGVVVHIYPEGRAYEVEFMTLAGSTIAVATVESDKIRPVTDSDIPHARPLAAV